VEQNRIVGSGGYNSAIKGANIVMILAPILQTPKVVPAQIAGNIYALAK
jgi:ketol-acid reductoisomerase